MHFSAAKILPGADLSSPAPAPGFAAAPRVPLLLLTPLGQTFPSSTSALKLGLM